MTGNGVEPPDFAGLDVCRFADRHPNLICGV